MADGYAGDVSPREAWEMLQRDNVYLVDCRTIPEWRYVGRPDLSPIGKDPVLVEWQVFPSGDVNPHFVSEVLDKGVGKDATILTLCRSGVRSIAAAQALTAAGFENCFNILEGFEGDKDDQNHRATLGGWKVAGLPWEQ